MIAWDKLERDNYQTSSKESIEYDLNRFLKRVKHQFDLKKNLPQYYFAPINSSNFRFLAVAEK